VDGSARTATSSGSPGAGTYYHDPVTGVLTLHSSDAGLSGEITGAPLYTAVMADWLNRLQAEVSAGTWHHVALVLEGAGRELQEGAMSLYLDGEEVATGPGIRVGGQQFGPKVGWPGRADGNGFTGRIADFVQANDARPPE
jgi:hypothetical protein